MIDLSIIVVNYNNNDYLENCLGSVDAFTDKISFEILFVDNNSSDGSIAFVREKFPKVKIIQNNANLGFTRANNAALKVYQGRYTLLLNTDTIIRPGALDKLVNFMDNHPKAGACGPKLLNINGSIQHQGGFFNRKFWLAKNPVEVDYVIGAALLVRRETIDQVGVMDENFFFSNDDLDWCRRIRKAGWQIFFVPEATIIHYGGFTIKRFHKRLFVEGFRGGLYFCKKHYGGVIYQIYRFLLALTMLLAIIFVLPFYPWLKNKEKVSAFMNIMFICIKGELRGT